MNVEVDQNHIANEVPVVNENTVMSCSQGHYAHNVCLNSNCTKHVFLCDKKNSCQCFKNHKGCIKSSIESISEALQEKIISIEPFENKITELIDKAIDDLSLFADEIINKARDSLNFVGLNESERKFMKIIKKGENHLLTGKQMHDIYLSIDSNELFNIHMAIIDEKINNTWNSFEEEMKQSFSSIKKFLGVFSDNNGSLLFGNSKVIKKYEERSNILGFFTKNIAWTTLLYQASTNQFAIEPFFQNCKDITNTIVVCRTQYGKVIGGYTPVAWAKTQNQSFFEDHTKESFICSVTNNDKFYIQNNVYAVRHSPFTGPTFGNTSGIDFGICDKANTVSNSSGNINCAYYNEKYKRSDQNSWQRFSGSKVNHNFLIQEWEVWHIEFENK